MGQVHILILEVREVTLDSNVSSRNGKKCESGKERSCGKGEVKGVVNIVKSWKKENKGVSCR